MDRRHFLRLGLGGLLLAHTRLSAAAGDATRLLSCYSDHQGKHYLCMLEPDGRVLMNIPLPGRGHGVAVDPQGQLAAVFARRPGDFVWIVDLHARKVVHRIQAEPGRHYYGHGVFTAQGRLLCSENDFANGRGVIGVYDTADGMRRSGEFPSHGIGPHEIHPLHDGHTLAVANGGILTHPDLPRVKSNLQQMRPNLAYVDTRDGELRGLYEPPAKWHQLSIRHIDVAPDDSVAIAMQFEGQAHRQPPLIALHSGSGELRLLTPPPAVHRRLRNYCGSVTYSDDGSRFAVSSPRGGLVTYWSASGNYLGLHEQADACGVSDSAAHSAGFLVSDGGGGIRSVNAEQVTKARSSLSGHRWDNHLLRIVRHS